MHEAGSTENAILALEKIQQGDPAYESAQALITQWKAALEKATEEEVPSGPSQEQLERFNLLVEAGRDAHSSQRFIRARKYFERAAKILPLDSESLALKNDTELRLQPLSEEIELFNKGEYTTIIPRLWRMLDEQPENKDIEHLIIDSYYNLALTDLQRGEATEAHQKLTEALEIRPESEELQRLELFARTYSQRPPDLIYRIFVKYLPKRS